MTKSPAFQFYPKDWLSSRKILMMPPEYEGAYIRLLCYCWDSGDCSLPDDDEELAVLSRLGEGWFKGGSTVVRKCFIPHPNKPGFLTNERQLEEHEKQAAWKEKSREGGRKSAAKRAVNKQNSKGGSTVVQPDGNRPVEPKGNSSTASASAIKKEDDSTVTSSAVCKSDFQIVFECGSEIFPQLVSQNTSSIRQWITASCDVELDILPELRRHANRPVKSWSYFTGAIMDAKATRTQPPPPGASKVAGRSARQAAQPFEKQNYYEGTEGFIVS